MSTLLAVHVALFDGETPTANTGGSNSSSDILNDLVRLCSPNRKPRFLDSRHTALDEELMLELELGGTLHLTKSWCWG